MSTTAQKSNSEHDQKAYMRKLRAELKQRGYNRISPTFNADEIIRLEQSAASHDETSLAAHVKTLALAKLDDRYLVPPDILARLDSLLHPRTLPEKTLKFQD